MKGNETLLQLKNASVQYGGVQALDDVSVSLDEGEVVALMGPNGAGKSTVLKAIFGIAPLSSGSVLWHEQKITPISHEVVQLGISFVPQGRRVFSSLTVEENIEIGAFGVSNNKEVRRRRDEVMELFPALRSKKNARAGTLSGGQQQMLAIARGLMPSPTVLLLDEPSLGLAPKVVKEVFEKIREINERRKIAVIIVEHSIKSALSIAHRAYLLSRGKVVFEGPALEVEKSGHLEEVF